jgi:hypothetical protein
MEMVPISIVYENASVLHKKNPGLPGLGTFDK